MNLPMLGNLVWMNAAEDQQMVVFGQVMERLDRCPEAFVLVEETKDPDQYRILGQGIEHRKALA
jgi:hypothetical protein